jgi:hypothetical protein
MPDDEQNNKDIIAGSDTLSCRDACLLFQVGPVKALPKDRDYNCRFIQIPFCYKKGYSEYYYQQQRQPDW